MNSEETEFDINKWALENDLPEDAVMILKDAGFTSRRRLTKLTKERINEYFKGSIRPADVIMLEDAIESLQRHSDIGMVGGQVESLHITGLNAQVAIISPDLSDLGNRSYDQPADGSDSSSDEFVLAEESIQETTGNTTGQVQNVESFPISIERGASVQLSDKLKLATENSPVETEFSTPKKPTAKPLSTKEVDVTWDMPENWTCDIDCFEIKYQTQMALRWTSVETEGSDLNYRFTNLKPGMSYKFKVRAKSEFRCSDFSPESEVVTTFYPSPSTPVEKEKTTSSITLTWDHTNIQLSMLQSLFIRYRIRGEISWKVETVYDAGRPSLEIRDTYRISGLTGNMFYEFQIYIIYGNGRSGESPISKPIATLRKPPQKPSVQLYGKNNVCVKWNKPEGNASLPSGYEIRYRSKNDERWLSAEIASDKFEYSIMNLEGDLTYEFYICARYEDSIGPTSEPEIITTKRFWPSCPTINSVGIKKALILSGAPEDQRVVKKYEIQFKRVDKDDWMSDFTDDNCTNWMLHNLEAGNKYHFRVRALFELERSRWSSVSGNVETKQSLAQIMASEMDPYCVTTIPFVYKIPTIEIKQIGSNKLRKCCFGTQRKDMQEKTIMLVGATGSGKSLLIEAMINYVFGVSWEDNFRFSLIHVMEDEQT